MTAELTEATEASCLLSSTTAHCWLARSSSPQLPPSGLGRSRPALSGLSGEEGAGAGEAGTREVGRGRGRGLPMIDTEGQSVSSTTVDPAMFTMKRDSLS